MMIKISNYENNQSYINYVLKERDDVLHSQFEILPTEPDRHSRPHRLHLRSFPSNVVLQRGASAHRCHPGNLGPDCQQLRTRRHQRIGYYTRFE
jgi:hypothetical protein